MLKNKNKYFSYIKNQSDRFVVILIVVLAFFGILNIDKTIAYFSDTESSTGNTFTAGTLTIDLDSEDDFNSGLMYQTDSTSTTIEITNTGTVDSKYKVETVLDGADTTACDYVTMTATSPSETYTGLIGNFVSTTSPTVDTTWNFDFTVDTDTPPSVWGKTCSFKWAYTAWQTDFSDSSSGFSNRVEKQGIIEIGQVVVLNEVLYNPNASSTAPADEEFIELYNNSNISIDLAGWQVSEMSSSTENKYTISATAGSYTAIPYGGSTIILANGWMVLQLSDSTALNNTGDTIRLYDVGGVNKLDEYTYIGGKPKGNSDARVPDGIGDWVDPIPSPGTANIVGEVIEALLPIATSTDIIVVASTTEEIIDEVTATTTATTTEETVTEDDTATTTEEVANEGAASTTEEVIDEDDTATTTKEIIEEITDEDQSATSTEEMENGTESGLESELIGDDGTVEEVELASEIGGIVEPVIEAETESVTETEPAPIIE